MVLAGFLFYFQFMTLQLRLAGGLDHAGAQIAKAYHLENILPDVFSGGEQEEENSVSKTIKDYAGKLAVSGLTGAYVRYAVVDYAGEEFLNASCMKNGSGGLSCYAFADGAMLELHAYYEVQIPFLPDKLFSFPVVQRLVRRMWVGVSVQMEQGEETESSASVVYVTRYGTVYHLYRDCRSLKRSIRSCAYASVGEQKNNEGVHYTACEFCIHGSANALVYVTAEGQRYHNSISCGALLRYIREEALSEVTGKNLCSYCRKRQEESDGAME